MNADVFEFAAHPAADVFPMLADDELNELAADIKANGLVHPIVVKDGLLIDGRNRREACRRAGVVPTTIELNGADPLAYIISTNIKRRHLNKGQQAMAVAMIRPEKHQGKKTTSSLSEEVKGTSLSYARTVLKWAPDLAQGVLAGAQALNDAYKIAFDRGQEVKSTDKRLAKLRTDAPDLADQVKEGTLALAEAEAAAQARITARDEEEKQQRDTALYSFDALCAAISYFRGPGTGEYFVEKIKSEAWQKELRRRVPIMSWKDYREKLEATELVVQILLFAIDDLED